MKTVFSVVNSWLPQRTAVALATVVETWGSSPRQAGAKMAFTADGKIVGSVSGGCVEGAVIEAGQETLQTGRPQLLHFGVADKTAWDVGLACGGTIEIFVQRLDTAVFSLLSQLINENRAGTVFTVIRGPGLGKSIVIAEDGRVAGTLGADLDERAQAAVPAIKQSQRLALTDSIEVFADAIRPAPTLVMVGGVHIAVALTSLAKTVGYRTVVVDPRRAFGDNERFPHADKLIAAWPDKAFEQIELNSGTAVALLTHDPKIDDPALKIVLNSPVFYIGALGSRRTHAQRRQRLQKMGFDDETINRIHGPIGLNIGARSPEEIALSIMAEIVNVRRLPLE